MYPLHVNSIFIPVFNSSYNLFSYPVCKVNTGTYILQSVTLNFKFVGVFTAATPSCADYHLVLVKLLFLLLLLFLLIHSFDFILKLVQFLHLSAKNLN